MIRDRVRQELQRQPRWLSWVLLVSTACTFASLLMRGRNHGFGGPVLYFVVLVGSGALLVLSIALLLLRGRTSSGDR